MGDEYVDGVIVLLIGGGVSLGANPSHQYVVSRAQEA